MKLLPLAAQTDVACCQQSPLWACTFLTLHTHTHTHTHTDTHTLFKPPTELSSGISQWCVRRDKPQTAVLASFIMMYHVLGTPLSLSLSVSHSLSLSLSPSLSLPLSPSLSLPPSLSPSLSLSRPLSLSVIPLSASRTVT